MWLTVGLVTGRPTYQLSPEHGTTPGAVTQRCTHTRLKSTLSPRTGIFTSGHPLPFYRTRRDERLGWPMSRPRIEPGLLDYVSDALTTTQLAAIRRSRKKNSLPILYLLQFLAFDTLDTLTDSAFSLISDIGRNISAKSNHDCEAPWFLLPFNVLTQSCYTGALVFLMILTSNYSSLLLF